VRLTALAGRYGTPAYVLDELDVRQRCRTYAAALSGAEVAYAGKAFLCRAMARWVAEEGLSLDVCSAGEIAVARSASFPASRITLHGNAKSPGDLLAAVDYGIGRIVIDSAAEIARLAALARHRQRVLVRVTPGVDAHAHPAVATGIEDQKFGFSLSSGSAADAVRRVLAHPELELAGLHCHLGSQLTSVPAFEVAARRLLGLMAQVHQRHGVVLGELNLGGGHAVPYVAGDPEFDLDGFASRIMRVVRDECVALRLPEPRLTIEPGRAIVKPGDGHRLPGARGQGRRRGADLRGGGRRHERQPPAFLVRGAVLGAGGSRLRRWGANAAGDRGGAALRSGGRASGRRSAAG